MTRYSFHTRMLAVALSGLAGFVDAVGFIALNGFFVSFMSGNSTRLALSLAEHSIAALTAGSLIVTFVGGVIVGSLLGHRFETRRRPVVIFFVSFLLAVSAILAGLDEPRAAIALMVIAMGAENAVFERDGDVHIGLTYMTGALVKSGQRIAAAIIGGRPLDWIPYVLLWGGLVLGACAGAVAHSYLHLASLWIAAAYAAILAFASLVTGQLRP